MIRRDLLKVFGVCSLGSALLAVGVRVKLANDERDLAAAAKCQRIKKDFEKDGVDRAVTNALAGGIMIDKNHACTPK